MSSARRIAKNTLLLTSANVINLVLGFLYAAYAARYLGANGYGTIAYSLALTGIFGSLADLGLGQLAVREISRDRSLLDKYVFNLLAIKLVLAFATVGLIIITANALGKGDRTTISVVYIIALSIGLSAFTSVFSLTFQAFEEMEYSSIGSVINGTVMISGALVAIHLGLSVVGFAYVYLAASIIGLIYNMSIYAIRFFRSREALDPRSWAPMFREAIPFGLAGLFVNIFSWISSVMLAYLMGNESVGWYNAAYRLIIILAIVPNIVNVSLFPVMCRFYVTSKDKLKFIQQRSFRYMALIGVPIGVGTTLIADKIIYFIFGSAYANSVAALQILVWASVLAFISSSFSRLLSSSNRQMTVTKIMALCAVVNIALNLLLIPRISYVGASLAAVASEITSLVLSVKMASSAGYGPSVDDLIFMAKVITASSLMGAFIIYMRGLNLFLLIASSAALYFAVSYLLMAFDRHDIELLRNILKANEL